MYIAIEPESAIQLLVAAPIGERVALVDTRFVGHLHSLRLALTDPRFAAAAVPGALTAQPEARPAPDRALAASAPGRRTRSPPRWTGTGTAVQRPELGTLVAAVPSDPQTRHEARAAVAAVDDEAVRLRTAVKSRDGFFTTFCISPYSRYLARWCARRGLTPNQVTTASLLTALIAAGCAATGTRAGFVAAGVLLLCSFVLDCTDGQLARYSLQYSTLGAWLDATFDRAKEYAYYAGLALGAARGGDDVWALALGAMVLQTCRHVVDFSFNEANHDATSNTSPTAALSDKLDSVGWTVWVRRMIVLPIGERWAMIAVLTAVTTPRIVFYALLIGCALAACYTTAGRVLRSLTRRAAAHRPGGPGTGGPRRLRSARPDIRPPRPRTAQRPSADRVRWAATAVVATVAPRPGGQLVAGGGRCRLRRLRRGSGLPARSRALSTGWCPPFSGPPSICTVLRSRGPLRGERGAARRFRTGGRGRLPSLRHGVPHPRRHRRAAAVAGARDRWARGPDAGGRRLAALLTAQHTAKPTSPSRSPRSPWPWRWWCSSRASASGCPPEHPLYTTKENPHDRPRAGGRRRTASAPLHRHPAQGPGARVDGRDATVLDLTLGNFAEVGLTEVAIVVGYRKEAVYERQAELEAKYGVKLTLIDNDKAEEWNNAYSLWCARDVLKQGVILANGDTVHPVSVEKTLLAARGEGQRIILALDTVKHARRRGDEGRRRRRQGRRARSPS